MLRSMSLLACFFLTGCTHILIVKGVKINNGGRETMHCIMHVNQNAITPELAQKTMEFCKAIEGSTIK